MIVFVLFIATVSLSLSFCDDCRSQCIRVSFIVHQLFIVGCYVELIMILTFVLHCYVMTELGAGFGLTRVPHGTFPPLLCAIL